FPFFPIETLSVTKTVGRGRTNLTFAMPTVVQADATQPLAIFDRRATPSRNPTMQMHFEPVAYGITSVSSYVMVFSVIVDEPTTFELGGNFGFLVNGGTRVVNGQVNISLVFKNVPASQQIFGFITQTGGGRWSWFSVQARFPPLVITQ